MQLSVLNRILLLNILPPEGDITTIKLIRRLREDLSFSEAEHIQFDIKKSDDGMIRWNPEAEVVKDVEFGPKALAVVEATLKKLSAEKKLTAQHIDLYEQFIKDE